MVKNIKIKNLILGVSIALITFIIAPEIKQYFDKRNKANAEATTITDRSIKSLEIQTQDNPDNIELIIQLSNLYLQRVRESSDTSYYSKIDKLLDKTITLNDNAELFALKAQLALGRHHFSEALVDGNKAVAINPDKAVYYGIIGDAQIELGKYDEAVNAIQIMVNKRPDLSSFNRVAYLREINGDIDGARTALQTAISSGAQFPENVAWSYMELGKLQIRNDLRQAEQTFNNSLSIVENYPQALDGLGRIAFIREDYDKSVMYFQKAVDRLPIAQFYINLGDVYSVKGDKTKADQQYFLAKLAYQASESSGVNVDMEMAMFLADHDIDLDIALIKAQKAFEARPSIFAADTLAWTHFKKGNLPEAQRYINEALKLGEHDPTILFHAGMINEKTGNLKQAKSFLSKTIELDKSFSIRNSSVANDTLKKL